MKAGTAAVLVAAAAAAAALLKTAGAADPVLKRSCTESDATRVDLDLRCPEGHVIHVVQSLTAIRAEGDISQCRFPPDCTRSRDGDVTGLFPACNGKRVCLERVELNSENFCPNGTGHRYVQLEYECVLDSSVLNICGDAPVSALSSSSSSSLYIRSPAFPGYGVIVHQRCTCTVHGEDLAVQLLVVKFTGRGGTLSIANDTTVWWRAATILQLYNRDIPGLAGAGTESVNITFNDNGSSGEEAWLRVTGSTGNISVRCGRDDISGESTVGQSASPATATTTTATATVTTSSSPVNTSSIITPSSTSTGSVTSPLTGVHDSPSTTRQGSTTPVAPGNQSQRPPDTASASSQSTSPAFLPSSPPCPSDGPSHEVNVSSCGQEGNATGNGTVVGKYQDDGRMLIIAISVAAAGALLVIVIIVLIIIACRRRQRRRAKARMHLHRVPAPNGDLYTVSKKSPRSGAPSSPLVLQGDRPRLEGITGPYAWHDLGAQDPPQPPPPSLGGPGGGHAGDRTSHEYWTLEPDPPALQSKGGNSKGGNSKGDNQPLYWVVEPERDGPRRFLGEQQRVWPQPHQYRDVHPYAVADCFSRQQPQRPGQVDVPLKRYQSADTDLSKRKEVPLGLAWLRNAHSYEKPSSKRSRLSSFFFPTSNGSSSKHEAKKPADDENDSAIGYSASDEAASENVSSILRVKEDFEPFSAQHSGDSEGSDDDVKFRPPRTRRADRKREKPPVGGVDTSRPGQKFVAVEVHAARPERPPPRSWNPPDMAGWSERGRSKDNQNKHAVAEGEVPTAVIHPIAEAEPPWEDSYWRASTTSTDVVVDGIQTKSLWEDPTTAADFPGPDSDHLHMDPYLRGRPTPADNAADELQAASYWPDRPSFPEAEELGEGGSYWGGEEDLADSAVAEELQADHRWPGGAILPGAEMDRLEVSSYRGGRTSSTDADTESNLDEDSFLCDDFVFEGPQSPTEDDSGLADVARDNSVGSTHPYGGGGGGPGHTVKGEFRADFPSKGWGEAAQMAEKDFAGVDPKEAEIGAEKAEKAEEGVLFAVLHSEETWC